MNTSALINKIYIAGPFFTTEESHVIEGICDILIDLKIPYYSPKDGFQYKKGEPLEKAKECFLVNIKCINIFFVADRQRV